MKKIPTNDAHVIETQIRKVRDMRTGRVVKRKFVRITDKEKDPDPRSVQLPE